MVNISVVLSFLSNVIYLGFFFPSEIPIKHRNRFAEEML